jgi:hypothetical protein
LALTAKLGRRVRRLSTENSRFVPKIHNIVINWGNSGQFHVGLAKCFNQNVGRAVNKLQTFHVLREAGVSVPTYVTTRAGAGELFADNGIVVCRTTLTGNSGKGIVIAKTPEELVDAPLYTRHARHKNEYRVHVAFGNVIDYSQKKKRSNAEESANILVRSHHNGWVFCRENVVLPDAVKEQAIAAVSALGLDFGAVDVGHRVGDNLAVVFEVNTAPGIEGTTVDRYVNAFMEKINADDTGRNQRAVAR